ncbi:MAG: hypothetical protein ABID09_04490 [Candidatus Omnitrophota bacterium]
MEKIVYIIHCVDAEGPLYESLEATFQRLHEMFGITLEPTRENLKRIQDKCIDFGKNTDVIASIFSSRNLCYNDTWGKIDSMLIKVMSPEFRNKALDSFGNGWVYNWYCVDHVNYAHNPRRRDMGFHKIFDHYKQMKERTGSSQDGIHWHFHPMSVYKEAHRCATSYVNSPYLYEILCRRIIERNWFPVAFRAGFQTERPDSHLFLEQWVPFDASNWAYREENDVHENQIDIAGGRSGDWRLAPDDWSIYQPNHDNYQIPGNCRRWICRCLDIKTRGRELTPDEVEKAFLRARDGKPTIMGIANHDFRNMAYEVDFARDIISHVSKRYPDVKFKFCEAVDAFRSAIYCDGNSFEPLELKVSFKDSAERAFLEVETVEGKVFGPQPFLSVKTKTGRFIHDNFDFDTSLDKWSYTFDYDSIHADDIDTIGVAANDRYGSLFVKIVKPKK